MREAQSVRDRTAVVASPCGDGTLAAGATQHGAARQSENSGERMAFATRLAHVRDVREDLDERTRLWYHERRLSYKGFGSWGRAGEARPHVEQNPLTRFGLHLQSLSEN